MSYSSPEGTRAQQLMPNPNDLNADVGLTYTEGMHDQQIAQVLLTYDQGGDCEALGVPHHTDRTFPMPMAGHVYLQTSSQWDGKYFRSEQKRPRIPDGMRCVPPSLTPGSNPTSPNNSHLTATRVLTCASWNQRNREGQLVDIPGDPEGRKLHLEYLSVRDSSGDLAGKKRKDPDNPNCKRGGLVRREYRLVPHDYGKPPPPRRHPIPPPPPPVPIELHTSQEVPERCT